MDPETLITKIGEFTYLLRQIDQGDETAEDAVFQAQYVKLRRLASQVVRACGGGLSMQTTDVLHEFYVRLKTQEGVQFNDTNHFLMFAGRKMRQIVWDYARKRNAAKRPTSSGRVSLDDVLNDLRHNGLATADAEPERLLLLKQLLERLEAHNQRDSELVDLHYFLGLSHSEIGERYNLAEDTIKKRLQFIRAWLGARASETNDGSRTF